MINKKEILMADNLHFVKIYYERLMAKTGRWTDEQFGAYMRLLITQFDIGYIPDNEIPVIISSAKKNWGFLKSNFTKTEAGWVNHRMEEVRLEALDNIEKNRFNGKKGGRPKKPKQNPTVILKKPNGFEIETQTEPKQNPNERQPLTTNQYLLKENNKENGISEFSTWETEKNNFLKDGGWIFKFCNYKNITVNQFDSLAKEFLEDVDLKSDFKDYKEIQRHFTNWFNKKKLSNIDFKSHGKQSASGLSEKELAERQELANLAG